MLRDFRFSTLRLLKTSKLQSRLRTSPRIAPIILPYVFPYIIPFAELRVSSQVIPTTVDTSESAEVTLAKWGK